MKDLLLGIFFIILSLLSFAFSIYNRKKVDDPVIIYRGIVGGIGFLIAGIIKILGC